MSKLQCLIKLLTAKLLDSQREKSIIFRLLLCVSTSWLTSTVFEIMVQWILRNKSGYIWRVRRENYHITYIIQIYLYALLILKSTVTAMRREHYCLVTQSDWGFGPWTFGGCCGQPGGQPWPRGHPQCGPEADTVQVSSISELAKKCLYQVNFSGIFVHIM